MRQRDQLLAHSVGVKAFLGIPHERQLRVVQGRDARRLDAFAVPERAAPACGPPSHPDRGSGDDADDERARVLEADERRPDRHAAHVVLRAVDRVDDPAILTVDRAGLVVEFLTDDGVISHPGEPLAKCPLDRVIGLAHGREVGLGRDVQILRPEPRLGDVIGAIGELECEREGVDPVHCRSIREARYLPIRTVWSAS